MIQIYWQGPDALMSRVMAIYDNRHVVRLGAHMK